MAASDLAVRWREEAAILRRRGAEPQAEVLEGCAEDLDGAIEGAGMTSGVKDGSHVEPNDDLLTAQHVAEIMKVTRRWVYDHADGLPFARRLSRKTLRFSRRGLDRWIRMRR